MTEQSFVIEDIAQMTFVDQELDWPDIKIDIIAANAEKLLGLMLNKTDR